MPPRLIPGKPLKDQSGVAIHATRQRVKRATERNAQKRDLAVLRNRGVKKATDKLRKNLYIRRVAKEKWHRHVVSEPLRAKFEVPLPRDPHTGEQPRDGRHAESIPIGMKGTARLPRSDIPVNGYLRYKPARDPYEAAAQLADIERRVKKEGFNSPGGIALRKHFRNQRFPKEIEKLVMDYIPPDDAVIGAYESREPRTVYMDREW